MPRKKKENLTKSAKRIQPETDDKILNRRSQNATIVGTIVAIITLMVTVIPLVRQEYGKTNDGLNDFDSNNTPISTLTTPIILTPSQTVVPASTKVGVLIAAFDGPEDIYGVQYELIEKLRSEFPYYDEVSIIPIEETVTPIQGSERARNLGEQHGADLVIWGWYRPLENTNFTLHVELLEPKEFSDVLLKESETIRPLVSLNDLQSLEWQQDLSAETTTLVTFLTGLLYYRSDDYRQALDRFNHAFELSTSSNAILSSTEILLYRGGTNIFLENYEDAIADFDTILQNDSKTEFAFFVYNDRGATYARIGEFEKALSDYETAIRLDPNHFVAYMNRGLARAWLGGFDLSIQDFNKAIELDQTYAVAFYSRGLSYFYVGNLENAIDDFSKAIELDSEYVEAYTSRGRIYDDLGKYDLAIVDLNRAIQIDPEHLIAYINRGVTFLNLSEYQKAINDFSTAIEIDPACAICYQNRAAVYYKLGDIEASDVDFQKYQELSGIPPNSQP